MINLVHFLIFFKKNMAIMIHSDFTLLFSCRIRQMDEGWMLGAGPLTVTPVVDMVNHVTGFDYTLEDVLNVCCWVWYLKQGLTNNQVPGFKPVVIAEDHQQKNLL
jgi:hypothetical protein